MDMEEETVESMNMNVKAIHECNSHLNHGQEVDEKCLSMTGKEIIENLPLLENGANKLYIKFSEYLLNLVDLHLANNQLDGLPKSIIMLRNLACLNLDNNNFLVLPSVVCELYSLKQLWASKNRMKEVPKELGNLLNLEVLHLSNNCLTELPNSCAKLNRLEICSLENNRMKRIPICIARGMKSLQFLDFSQNPNSDLNVYPKTMNLVTFCAEGNGKCPSFPKWILSSKYKKLETVVLNETRFQRYDIPRRWSMSYIKRLSMKQCNLQMKIVESIVTRMTNLEELIIGNNGTTFHNCFWDIPIHTKRRPSTLKEIDMCDTGLPMIPKIINKFINLSCIKISSNQICYLPEEICLLKNLETLIMDKNYVAKFPDNIGKLVSLKYLKARYNRLNMLPECMKSLKNLQYMDLYDNEFKTVPEVVLNISSLIGLDLEQNYFSTECLRYLRVPNYEAMRENLRNVWPDTLFGYKSLLGPKLKLNTPDRGTVSPSSDSSSTNISEEDTPVFSFIPTETYNKLLNDHWDTSEDSAEEFDPHECKEPKKKVYTPFTFYKPFQRVYCPAEVHEARVITRVAQMLKNGSLVWSSTYEEGQFEDA